MNQAGELCLDSSDPAFLQTLQSKAADLQATVLFDAVAGELTGRLLTAMPDSSVAIVYGSLSLQHIGRIHPVDLIFKRKSMRGFHLEHDFLGEDPVEKHAGMLSKRPRPRHDQEQISAHGQAGGARRRTEDLRGYPRQRQASTRFTVITLLLLLRIFLVASTTSSRACGSCEAGRRGDCRALGIRCCSHRADGQGRQLQVFFRPRMFVWLAHLEHRDTGSCGVGVVDGRPLALPGFSSNSRSTVVLGCSRSRLRAQKERGVRSPIGLCS